MTTDRSDDGLARTTIADRILAQLSDVILRGELSPGAKLSEPELARQLGTSRAPLREAITRLEERKLVTREPHFGARVVELTPKRIREIFVVREALEGIAAREAANRMTDDDIARLQGILLRHKEYLSGNRFNEQDFHADPANDFHLFIIKCSGNELLINFLGGECYNLIRLCRRRMGIAGRHERSFLEHVRIANALSERDAEVAELMMRRHVAAAMKELESFAESTLEPKKLKRVSRD